MYLKLDTIFIYYLIVVNNSYLRNKLDVDIIIARM
jgi:hypothetical protein